MKVKLVYFLIASCIVGFGSAVNILLLEEVPSPSHHVWFRVLTRALASKGYNVTIATCDTDESSTNIHYIHMEKVYETLYNTDEAEVNFVAMGSKNFLGQMYEFQDFSIKTCVGFTKSDGWKRLANYPDDFKFDLIIHDYLMGGCLISFANKFKNVPLIGMTAFNDNFIFTSYTKSSVVPSLSVYSFYNQYPKTYLERIFNYVILMTDKIIFNFSTIPQLRAIVQESTTFKNTPSTLELGSRSVVYLINHDASVDGFIQQFPRNVIPVGGLQIKEASPLPEDLQSLADAATNGLVLFSLGTNVQSEMLGEERILSILEAFRQLSKYMFVWKINTETFPVPLPSNVFIRKWIPQNDLLAHNNTRLFITHAGLLSTQESIYHGVPMLGIPIFADQFINIRRSVEKGFADILLLKDFSAQNFIDKVENLLTQTKYRKQIKIASAAFSDQKEKPLERALWWIDWVMRNPNTNDFKSPGSDLNFLQLESLDIILFLVVAAFLPLYAFAWFFKLCLKCIFGNLKYVKGKSKNE